MRRGRVLVLRLGVWGLEVDAKSVRSARKRPQAFASVRKRPPCVHKRPRRETHDFRLFWTRVASSRHKSVNSLRDRAGPGRETAIFGLAWRLCISRVSTVTGIGGSWPRNAKLSSLLDSRCVFASQKCQGGVLVALQPECCPTWMPDHPPAISHALP